MRSRQGADGDALGKGDCDDGSGETGEDGETDGVSFGTDGDGDGLGDGLGARVGVGACVCVGVGRGVRVGLGVGVGVGVGDGGADDSSGSTVGLGESVGLGDEVGAALAGLFDAEGTGVPVAERMPPADPRVSSITTRTATARSETPTTAAIRRSRASLSASRIRANPRTGVKPVSRMPGTGRCVAASGEIG